MLAWSYTMKGHNGITFRKFAGVVFGSEPFPFVVLYDNNEANTNNEYMQMLRNF